MTIFEKVKEKANKQGLDVAVTVSGKYLLFPIDKQYAPFQNLLASGTLFRINFYLNHSEDKVA
jgi:hypothetical protein